MFFRMSQYKFLLLIPFKINKCIYIHKRLYGKCPLYFSELLTCNFNIHNRSSRYGAVNLVCPCYKRETEGRRSFSVSACRRCNSLPNNIKKLDCVDNFKKVLFEHSFNSFNDLDHFTISIP